MASGKWAAFAAEATMCGNCWIDAEQDRRSNQRAPSNRLPCRSTRKPARIGRMIRGKSKPLSRKRATRGHPGSLPFFPDR
jgi:hypothetical protein